MLLLVAYSVSSSQAGGRHIDQDSLLAIGKIMEDMEDQEAMMNLVESEEGIGRFD